MKSLKNHQALDSGNLFTLPPDNHLFESSVSVEAYNVLAAQLIKQMTPPDFPYTLRAAPFDAETPLHICIKNKPLGDALRTCATLLNAQWREEKASDSSQKTSYVLEPKPDAIAHEKALYTATVDLNTEPLTQTARLATHHGLNYWRKQYQKVHPSPDTHDEPSTDKRLLQFLARPDGHFQAILDLFASITRTQRRTLASDGYLVLPWSTMSAVQQQSVLASRHIETRIAPNSANDMTPEQNRIAEQNERESVQRSGVIMSVDKAPVSGRIVYYRLAVGTNEGRTEIRIPDPDVPFLLPVRGNPYFFDIGSATATAAENTAETSEGATLPLKTKAVRNTNEATLEKLPFPSDIRFAKTDTWADVVQTLVPKLPFTLVSDAYTAARLCKFPPSAAEVDEAVTIAGDLDKMTVAQALDAICTAYNYLWWYEPGKNNTKGILFFRSQAWFVEKRYEPPASAAAKAMAALQSDGKRWENTALIDSVVGLSIEQLQGIAARMLAAPHGYHSSFSSRTMWSFMAGSGLNSACSAFYWLRFWSHLTPEQKQRMMSADGLPGSALDEVQKNELLQNSFTSSSQVSPVEVAAAQWEKARLHAHYQESQAEDAPIMYSLKWKPNELHSVSISFFMNGAGIAYGSPVALPVALAPPPQPKKAIASKTAS